MGVCRVAQLSTLTPEDYPALGVHATEDHSRLFHLVQLVKSVGHDGGDDWDTSDGAVSASSDGWWPAGGDTGPRSSSPVKRRLDFSGATAGPHPEPSESPAEPPVDQRHRPSGSRPSERSRHSCTRAPAGEASEPSVPRRHLSAQSPRTPSSAGRAAAHKLLPGPNPGPNPKPNQNLNPRHTIVRSEQRNQSKVKEGFSRPARPGQCSAEDSGTCRQRSKPTAVYSSDRAAGYYNYGLPRQPPPSPHKK